jgi:hypothetical protein
MAAEVTTLDRKIAAEGRRAGLPTDQPLTDGAIARRRFQIAMLLCACGLVAVFAVYVATGLLQSLSILLAMMFAGYAIGQDGHLRRLGELRSDSRRITLVVARELMCSGALTGDRELLDLRDGIGRAAGRLAAGLADVVACDCARVRLLGPSGELPIAAERELAARRPVPDDDAAARDALRLRKPVRATTTEGRGVLVVPVWRGNDVVGMLEAVSPPEGRYLPGDASRAGAFARGAVSALSAAR